MLRNECAFRKFNLHIGSLKKQTPQDLHLRLNNLNNNEFMSCSNSFYKQFFSNIMSMLHFLRHKASIHFHFYKESSVLLMAAAEMHIKDGPP